MDIILSFYATPGKSQANPIIVQPVQLLKGSAKVYVGGMSANGASEAARFGNFIEELRSGGPNGRALPNTLKRLGVSLSDAVGARVCLICFSAGRAAVSALLKNDEDRDAIDTVIDLDGLHFMKAHPAPNASQMLSCGCDSEAVALELSRQMDMFTNEDPYRRMLSLGDTSTDLIAIPQTIDPWIKFGSQAIDGSKLLVTAHTEIASPSPLVYSTTESNQLLFDTLETVSGVTIARPMQIDKTAWSDTEAAGLPMTIFGQAGDTTRTYSTMPDLNYRNVGNTFSIAIPGNRAGDHIFTCYAVQSAIWRSFLIPRWNMVEGCTPTVSAPSFNSAPSTPQVVVYSIDGCPWCVVLKNYLDKKGITYIVKDDEDDANKAERKQLSIEASGDPNYNKDGGRLPVSKIGSKIILGWDQDAVDKALAEAGCTGTTRLTSNDTITTDVPAPYVNVGSPAWLDNVSGWQIAAVSAGVGGLTALIINLLQKSGTTYHDNPVTFSQQDLEFYQVFVVNDIEKNWLEDHVDPFLPPGVRTTSVQRSDGKFDKSYSGPFKYESVMPSIRKLIEHFRKTGKGLLRIRRHNNPDYIPVDYEAPEHQEVDPKIWELNIFRVQKGRSHTWTVKLGQKNAGYAVTIVKGTTKKYAYAMALDKVAELESKGIKVYVGEVPDDFYYSYMYQAYGHLIGPLESSDY